MPQLVSPPSNAMSTIDIIFSFHYFAQLAYIIWPEMDKSLRISFIYHLEKILQYHKRDIGFMSLIYHKVIQSSLKEPADF